jgi:hypothetical protein
LAGQVSSSRRYQQPQMGNKKIEIINCIYVVPELKALHLQPQLVDP